LKNIEDEYFTESKQVQIENNIEHMYKYFKEKKNVFGVLTPLDKMDCFKESIAFCDPDM